MDPQTNTPPDYGTGPEPVPQPQLPPAERTFSPDNYHADPPEPMPAHAPPPVPGGADNLALPDPSTFFTPQSPSAPVYQQPVAPRTPLPVMPIPDDGGHLGQPGVVVSGGGRSFKPLALLTVVLVLLLGGGAAAYYFGYYMSPSVILSQSLSNTGKGYTELVSYLDNQSKVSNRGSIGSGTYSVKSPGWSTDGKLSFQSDDKASDTTFDFGVGGNRVKVEVRGFKPSSSSTNPDIYFKASGIKGLGAFAGTPQADTAVNQLDGKWISVDHTMLDTLEAQANKSSSSATPKLPDRAQILDEVKTFGQVNQQYVFTTDKNKAVTVVVKKYGVETVDGHKAYHYLMGFDKAHVKTYITAQRDALKSSQLGSWMQQNGYMKDVNDSYASLEKSADTIKSTDTFDLWADTKTRLVYKIRVTDKSVKNATNYTDAGLDYKGGATYPFFISGVSKQDGSDASFKLVVTLDRKTGSVGVNLTGKSTGSLSGTLNADFTFKPSNAPANISVPSGSVPLSQALDQLGLGSLLQSASVYSGQQAQAKDAKRQSDLKSLQTQLEAYFTQTGNYPTLAQMNDSSWLKGNMPDLDTNAMQDPDGSSTTLAAKPAAKVYAYQPTDDSGSADNCASAASQCTKYTLTATLSDGSQDQLTNLD